MRRGAGLSKTPSSGKPHRRGRPSLLFPFIFITLTSSPPPPPTSFVLSTITQYLSSPPSPSLHPYSISVSVLLAVHPPIPHPPIPTVVRSDCPVVKTATPPGTSDPKEKTDGERASDGEREQTHETTVGSPPKRRAQRWGPEELAGPSSTSFTAILNTNRRGLADETKP